jgi:alkylation response protein AidB-like acyl-CoA dehydrogenase
MTDIVVDRRAAKVDELRLEVRGLLREERAHGVFEPRCDAWLGGFSPPYSRTLGSHGLIGLTFPRQYGGQALSPLHRFAVVEELLAAGAPVAAHWTADRQSGPAIVRFGTSEQKETLLPGIARGELYFAIGMSEPDSGSDLASIRASAVRVDGGWRTSGTKVWTSNAQRCDYMVALVRTQARTAARHAGLSQFIVDLRSPGVTIKPIPFIDGNEHFCEVVLDSVFVPDSMVLGTPGDGWAQVMSELNHERSGPERYLSSFALYAELVAVAKRRSDASLDAAVGRLGAQLWAARQMGVRVAEELSGGGSTSLLTAVSKDVGTQLEGEIVEVCRDVLATEADPTSTEPLRRLLADAVLHGPAFTLRGGTTEILRGLIAREVGVR